ncbi:MFS transporter [Kitasatospora sp. NPDC056138]|uniref:MFS transporter n=1 Tax=Kitasatospora sp. NPDC056138 TaxID=3345724 RepID=UPI0035E1EFCB
MAVELAVEDPPRVERQRASFVLLGAVQIVLIATITVITVALPAIQRELRLTEAEMVFAISAYSLSFGGLLMLGGRLADLFGHRRVFVAGVLVFGLASAAAAASPSLWVLVLARFAQGVGAAGAAPAAMALLGSVFPEPVERGRALAVWGVLASIGASSGNILSGVVLTWVSWRWIFVVPAVLAAVVVLLAPRVLPTGPGVRRERLDTVGAVLITAGLAALIFGLGELRFGWIAAGAVLIAAFVLSQKVTAKPLVPLPFLASPRRATALVAIALTAAGMATYFFLLTLFFQQVRGYSPIATSGAFVPPALSVLLAATLAGRALQRFRPGLVTAAGLGVSALGLLILAGMEQDTPYFGPLLAGLVIFPIGAGFTFSGATVWAVSDAPGHQAGLAGGVMNTAMEIGPPVGLAVLVPIATAHAASLTGLTPGAAAAGGYGFAFAVAAAALAAVAVLALLQRGRAKQP